MGQTMGKSGFTSIAAALAGCAFVMALVFMAGPADAFAADLVAEHGSQGDAALVHAPKIKTSAEKPKASKVLSMSFKSNMMIIKWKKAPGVDGYELKYSQDSYFGGSKVTKQVEFTKKRNLYNAFTKCMIKGRTSLTGDVLSARIRTFKVVGGKRVYSSWSETKSFVTRTTWNRTLIAPKKYVPGEGALGSINELNTSKVTKLHNKNANIAKVGNFGDWMVLEVFKPGTAITTFRFLGKTITLKMKVVKWTAPIRSFKVGKKDYTKKAILYSSIISNGWNNATISIPIAGRKLSIKPAEHWVISAIYAEDLDGKRKKVSSNYRPKEDEWLEIWLQNTRTKAKTHYDISNTTYTAGDGFWPGTGEY